MIIRIQSEQVNKLLSGKALSFDVLRSAIKYLAETCNETDFIAKFCSAFGYKELPYCEGYAAYILDLDRKHVYVTSYTFPRELGGAQVLYFTDRGHFEPVTAGDSAVLHHVFYLAICKYENEDGYYIFHCDEELNVVADDHFQSIDMCKCHCERSDVVWHKQKD